MSSGSDEIRARTGNHIVPIDPELLLRRLFGAVLAEDEDDCRLGRFNLM